MRTTLALTMGFALLWPCAGNAAMLDDVAKAMGAANLKSIQMTGSGVNFAVGQSPAPGMPWPRFNVKSYTRAVNYDTASLRDELIRTQALDPPRGGGLQPIRGEQRQTFLMSGDHAWNSAETFVRHPLRWPTGSSAWSTPHGVVKAAMAGTPSGPDRYLRATGRFTLKATMDDRLVQVGPVPSVWGDMPVEVTYSDYKDFGGVSSDEDPADRGRVPPWT
jgi:hypothetical protein